MKLKLNKELIGRISGFIANGNYHAQACAMCHIGTTTFYRWLEKGEHEQKGLFRDLWDAVKEAESVAEARFIQTIVNDDSWQSKAWLLERRFPERWGRKDRLEANVNGSVQVQFVPVEKMSVDEWRTKIVNPDVEALPDPAEVN
jgi:transposase